MGVVKEAYGIGSWNCASSGIIEGISKNLVAETARVWMSIFSRNCCNFYADLHLFSVVVK